MKSRLAASISFLPGARSNNICRTWKAFNFGLTSIQHGSSNGSIHSSSMEDDSFAELGPPVTERAVSQLKLATEKPEHFIWKNKSARKMSSKNEDKNHKKGTVSSREKSCQSIAEPVDASNASSSTDTIRIQGIDDHASIHDIHSLCKTLGNLDGLEWVGNDAIDAFFTVASESDSQRILEKLNDTTIGNSHLSASLLSSNSTASKSIKEIALQERGLQFSTSIDELRRQMDLKRIYLEDLEMLHHGIMHLQCLPTMSD
ncbi:PREDICTED: uncharacterized protein LOC109159945 [Ipomoea nil]|uniref:uncharacterized protein LOC109159945 n=1 Tax=Ipomoea nil TaxID=35883 RepID=UPI000900F920|nr:PREDICTED: uncharacterized protein LOC109159945 [Ipomoea nil]